MKISKTKFIIIILAAIIGSLFLVYPLLNEQFPDNGTVNRDIWFVKSTHNETPYFIIKDDIITKKGMDIEWIQHGREDLKLNTDDQSWNFTTTDDFDGNDVKLYGRIITSAMSFDSGESFATSGSDQTAPYLIANSNGPQQICTVLFPLNESMELPELDILKNNKNQTCFKIHHQQTYDIFWSRFTEKQPSLTEEVNGWKVDAESIYLRTNSSSSLFSLGFQKATKVEQNDNLYFQSTEEISGTLALSHTELSGQLEVINPCTIKLKIPDPGEVTINGKSGSYEYKDGLLSLTFSSSGNYTLGDQYENVDKLDVEKHEVISAEKCLENIQDLTHPYLLYESSEIDNILTRLHNDKNLNLFYGSLNETSETLEDMIFQEDGSLSFEEVLHPTMKKGLIGWILHYYEGDDSALEKIKKVLANLMDYHYSSKQTLDSALMSYGAILAYDSIYQDLSEQERNEYAEVLKEFVVPLAEPHEITPLNNHLAVNMGSVGLVGLVTRDADLLQIAIDETETYISEETYDGIPIESFNYAHFGYETLMPFLYSMHRLNLVNYLKEKGKVERFYERTLDMLSPTGVYPHYEDASDGPRQAIWLRLYSHLTSNEELRQNIAYFFNIQNQSSFINLQNQFTYLELFFWKNLSDSPSPQAENRLSWVSYKGGNGALRSSWDEGAVFVSFNAKTYHQSHTHLDEMSYEIYAYGAMLSMNIGYPGWKKEHHADCVSTFGSNLIRLNNQDQLQETCNGFSFHSFSSDLDIITMEGGNVYRSPFSFKLNPILYVIVTCLQIAFSIIAVYLYIQLRNKNKNGKKLGRKTLERETKDEMIHKNDLERKPDNFSDSKAEHNTSNNELFKNKIINSLGKPKSLVFILLYVGTFLRLFAFSFSILRKMQEWVYTQDYQMISTIYMVIWAALFILPFLSSLILVYIGIKIKRRILNERNDDYIEKSSKFNKKFKQVFPFLIIITVLFNILYFLREYNLMDYLSKDFGTLIAFSYDLVHWTLFQFLMIVLIFTVTLITYIYLFRGVNPPKFKKIGITLVVGFLIMLTIWFILSIGLYIWINSFTIESWFA